jgi:hypothetical protein
MNQENKLEGGKWSSAPAIVCVLLTWALLVSPLFAQSTHVGLRKQLFIDDYVVASTAGTTRKLHQPVKHPGNPIISPPAPQEGNEELLHLGGSVIYDEEESLFKMWYEANNATRTHAAMAYATSTDGINWDMPCFNTISYPEWDAPGCNSGENNFVWDETVIRFYTELVVSVFKDPHETDPARRYKMIYRKDDIGAGTGSVWSNVSPDGINWTHETSSIIQDADSFHSALWDPGLGKYVIHSRFNRNNHPTLPPQRQVLQSESDDFVNWTTHGVILAPDALDPPDLEFYNMEWMPYEDVFIGFPAAFHTASDKIDVQLAFSRDNRNWERAGDREVFIPNSQTPGDYDYGMIWNILQHPIVVGDEIFIYYDGTSGLHGAFNAGDPQGGVIALAKLRLDGFISMIDDTGLGLGTLTTRPLTTAGDSLVVNADASSGSVQVEVLDAAGIPVPGFSKADADPITGDDVRHVVTWNGGSSIADLEGGPFSLKFHLDGADLYSFVFSRPGATEWMPDGVGLWSNETNWAPAVPNPSESIAIFGSAITSNRTVAVESAVTVKAIEFDNANSYVLGGSGSVTLAADTGNAKIDVIQGDQQFQAVVNLGSDTDANVAGGASLAFNAELNLHGNNLAKTGSGDLRINNELNTEGGTVSGLSGSISGSGSVKGDLHNDGATLSPGNSPGVFTVTGDYRQGANGRLSIEIGGVKLGDEHDLLGVTGTIKLAGMLEVTLIDGFTPRIGDTFEVLDFGLLEGSFEAVQLPVLPAGLAWNDVELYSSGTLAVVPEPSASILLGLGLSVISAYRGPPPSR